MVTAPTVCAGHRTKMEVWLIMVVAAGRETRSAAAAAGLRALHCLRMERQSNILMWINYQRAVTRQNLWSQLALASRVQLALRVAIPCAWLPEESLVRSLVPHQRAEQVVPMIAVPLTRSAGLRVRMVVWLITVMAVQLVTRSAAASAPVELFQRLKSCEACTPPISPVLPGLPAGVSNCQHSVLLLHTCAFAFKALALGALCFVGCIWISVRHWRLAPCVLGSASRSP